MTSLPINSNYYKNKSEFLRTDDANKLPTFKRGERVREGPRGSERGRETKKVSKCRPEEKVRKVWT